MFLKCHKNGTKFLRYPKIPKQRIRYQTYSKKENQWDNKKENVTNDKNNNQKGKYKN